MSRVQKTIKDLFYISVADDYRDELSTTISQTNIDRVVLFSRIFVFWELAMIIFSWLFKGRDLFVQPGIYYFAMYLVLLVAASASAIMFNGMKKNIDQHVRGIQAATIIFSISILSWCAGISLLDQISYGQIVIYIGAIISLAVIPLFQPYILLLIYTLVQAAFILLISLFQPSGNIVFGNIANSTLILILAVVISRMRFKDCVSIFENGKKLEQKSQELETVNKELKQANEKLKLLSQRDGLTHIFNRSMFDKSMKLEWRSCRKNRLPLSLIMVDIDFFKSLNDSFGHQIGDHCLQQVADVLVFCANRSRDVVSRYGGDEFAVILPQTDQDGAMTIANKLRENVSKLVISGIDSQACQSITISIGVCCVVPSENSSSEDLIKNADQALYEAKKIRNSIHFQSIDVIDVNVI